MTAKKGGEKGIADRKKEKKWRRWRTWLGWDCDVKEKKKIKENRNEELKEAGGKSSWKERRKWGWRMDELGKEKVHRRGE
jgi:hypothetical protein